MTVKRYDAPKLRAWSDDAQGFCVVESADYDALLSLNSELLEALIKARYHVSMSGTGDELADIEEAIAKARSQS